MVGAARILVVVDHPVHVAVDQHIGIAQWQGVGPHRGDLPHALAGAIAFGEALVEVQLEVIEAGHVQVEARADQVGLGVAFAELVGHGQQHVFDWAELKRLVKDFAEGQPWRELTVIGVRADVAIFFAVIKDAVEEEEVIAVLPAVCVFEGQGLLNRRIDLKVLAPQVSQAVGLPLQQVASNGRGPAQQAPREHQAGQCALHSVAPKNKCFAVNGTQCSVLALWFRV